ncbi:cutinase 1 [Apiospora arundinis]|uniref:cutinase n=1 Tax=Apiospora arundinis TaxID=335852 RepID=A0ABR2IX80_9PEZI
MKSIFFTALVIISLASALPFEQVEVLDARQVGSANSNDLKDGKCARNVFIFARGSTETGNMGTVCGPQTCSGLKSNLNNDVICQGVGDRDGYAADIPSNFLPKNTNAGAIDGTVKLIQQAASQCPGSNILLAGYSQGSAVMDNAIQALDALTKDQVKGVVMYGFTRNAQDKGQVPGYPKDQTKVFCAAGDLVCVNTLDITPAHLTYGINAPEAARFLAGTVKN